VGSYFQSNRPVDLVVSRWFSACQLPTTRGQRRWNKKDVLLGGGTHSQKEAAGRRAPANERDSSGRCFW
jgi:hypothetical protein